MLKLPRTIATTVVTVTAALLVGASEARARAECLGPMRGMVAVVLAQSRDAAPKSQHDVSERAGGVCGDPPATNTACTSALEISGEPGLHEVLLDVTDATVQPEDPLPSCAKADPTGHTVWFKITPDITGFLTVSTCHPNTTFDAVLEVYTGTCAGGLFDMGCNDDNPNAECVLDCPTGRAAEITISVAAGNETLFQVGSFNENSEGCDLCLGVRTNLFQCVIDVDCDDGRICTDDSCVNGVCANSPVPNGVSCEEDGNDCTENRCDGAGTCVETNRDAGSSCGSAVDDDCDNPDTCDGLGVCLPNNELINTPCSDEGNDCTDDLCDGAGLCVHPDLPVGTACVDDGNSCTDDQCDDAGTCTHVDNSESCDDGQACTDADVCSGGSCSGTPIDCFSLDDQCHLGECNGTTGFCEQVPAFEGSTCDDGESCTVSATCQGGACLGTAVDCSGAGDSCNDAVCDAKGVEGNCDVLIPLPVGTACDDGVFCNGFETCDGLGTCQPGVWACSEGEVCDEDFDECALEFDCNDNGITDECDVDCGPPGGLCEGVPSCGKSPDCNGNGIPDECDVVDPCGEPVGFCSGEGDCCAPGGNASPGCDCAACCHSVCLVAPLCCIVGWDASCAEMATMVSGCDCGEPVVVSSDCNGNGVPDECEADCDEDGVPNECAIADCFGDPTCDDCNQNGIPDGCDIVSGFSLDVNPADGVPDECVTSAPGEHDWTSDIWNLNGGYPDNVDNASGLHVTINAGNILLNETVEIEGLRVQGGSELRVTQVSEGDLRIAPESSAGIVIDGSIIVDNNRIIDVLGGPFTLGEGARYVADPDAGGLVSASLSAQSIKLLPTFCGATDQMTLRDAMTALVNEDFVIDGSDAHPCPCRPELCPPGGNGGGAARGGRTLPIFRLFSTIAVSARDTGRETGSPPPGAPLSIRGSLRILFGAEIEVRRDVGPLGGPVAVELSGNFDNQSVFPSLFDWVEGELILSSSQELRAFEVAGIDLGPTCEGFDTDADALFDRTRHTNFSMGSIKVEPGNKVEFVNEHINTVGVGKLSEALYVGDLVLGSSSHITLIDTRVYYKRLIDHGAVIETSGAGELVQLPTGDFNNDKQVNLIDWSGLVGCLVGPDNGPISSDCIVFDFDADTDVDMGDVSEWLGRFSAP